VLSFLFLLQAAAAQTAPDIQLSVDVHADRVRIERRGEASLEVSGGEGSTVHVEAPPAHGRRTLRNVDVRVRAEARVAAPDQNRQPAETASPQ
jgi:hypothetical protein